MYPDPPDIRPILSALGKIYPLKACDPSTISLKVFTIPDRGEFFDIERSWEIEPNLYLLLIKNAYNKVINDEGTTSVVYTDSSELYCYCNLSKDFPHTIIRPSSFVSRIINFFTGRDVHIKGTTVFNRKYRLVTRDADRILSLLNKRFIQQIARTENTLIEITENECLVMNLKPVDYEALVRMVEISRAFLAL